MRGLGSTGVLLFGLRLLCLPQKRSGVSRSTLPASLFEHPSTSQAFGLLTKITKKKKSCGSCGRDEDVQGVHTLFGRGKAQVCHVLRVVELREQLEVEEEDGDRQEEEEEVESGETSQRGAPMNMTMDDYECAQNLSHEVCGVIINKDCEQCACRLSACTPRVR